MKAGKSAATYNPSGGKGSGPAPMTHLVALVLAATVLCSGVFCSSRASAQPQEKIYAVIVANNAAADAGTRALDFADNDGARYWEVFSSLTEEVYLHTTLDEEDQRVYEEAALVSLTPTPQKVLKTLRTVQDRMRRDNAAGHKTTLFVVFAGHGSVDADGMGYLSLQDGILTRRDLIREVVEPDVAHRTHIIIDACHAYFMVHARGDEGDARSGQTRAADFEAFFQSQRILARYPRVGVMLSTAGAARVHEWSEYRAGVFSHEVRSGLLGAADIDGDRKVTYREMEAYLEAANALVKDPKARIQVFTEAPRQFRETPLLDLGKIKGATMLTVEPGPARRYHISDSRGVRYLDFHTAGDGRFEVALLWRAPAFFVRSEAREARLSRDTPSPVSLSSLTFMDRENTRGPVEESYRANLFGLPYGRGFYEGFHVGKDRAAGVTDEERRGAVGESALQGVGLSFGYALSEPQITSEPLDGVQHGLDLVADFWLSEGFALELVGAYGTSAHSRNPLAENESFRLHRASVGVGARWKWSLDHGLSFGADIRTGHQWLFFSGGAQDDLLADIFSWRGELAGRVAYQLNPSLAMGLRAGMSLSLVSVTEAGSGRARETFDALPFAGVFVEWRP